MPELPDVEGFKSYLQSTSLHQRIDHTRVEDDRCLADGLSAAALARRLKHRSLTRAYRHGKWLLVETDGDTALTLHFGMTGALDYAKISGDLPAYARVVWTFAGDRRLAYISRRMLGRVGLTENLSDFLEEHELGPDALDEAIDREWFDERVRERSRQIKPLLMDQSFIAGIGSVYADEALYQAGIDPTRRAADLSEQDTGRLFNAMRRVLRTSAKHGGAVASLPDRYLLPHRGGDMQCARCGSKLKKHKVGGRPTVSCPSCQRG